eukprot:TRINITY_DN576_c0_g1_i1.p1 TRINITY_DN576_c0_g1~~TRINITY_DN576_c0_g1_i1.p1  ORF type:complete len:1565 (-),score=226.38 TRINITY_DN576_c0_g1_i1:14582-19174(-)
MDFTWAKDCIFDKLKATLPGTIEGAMNLHFPLGATLINKDTFTKALEKLNAGVLKPDIDKLAEQLENKDTHMIDINKFYSVYHEAFLPKGPSKESYEGIMEQVRKAVAEGFFDLCDIFKEYDSLKTGTIGLSEFEAGLKTLKLPAEHAQKFFETLDKNHTGKVSCKEFAKELEEYSLKKVSLPRVHVAYPVINKIRSYIKENSRNALKENFKEIVKKDFDGKRWITKKDFKEALSKMGVTLPGKTFDEFTAFLDPSKTDQIDYDFFSEVLGYVQPSERPKTPPANPPQSAKNSINEPVSAETLAKTQRIITEFAAAVKQGNYKLSELFVEQDYDKRGTIPKAKFIEILKTVKGKGYTEAELEELAQSFMDPLSREIRYKDFLSKLEQSLATLKPAKSIRTNLQWAGEILDEICIALYCRHESAFEYFQSYGLNPANDEVTFSGFVQGMKDLRIHITETELDRMKKDLDVNADGSISAKELSHYLSERKAAALEKCEKEILMKLQEYVKTRKVDLYPSMKKYDGYNTKEISTGDFETELRLQFKSMLSDNQYRFLAVKYEKKPGKVDYVNFIKDVIDVKEYAENVAELRIELLDKLRENIRTREMKIASHLLQLNNPTKQYSNTTLLDLFPRNLLTAEDFEVLTELVDKDHNGTFTFEALCSLLWTSEEEETSRVNAPAFARELNTKIGNYCKNKRIDLEAEFAKFDRDNSGYLSSEDMKTVFYNLGMKFSDRQLSALLYYQQLPTNSKWRKNYVDLILKVFGKTSLPERTTKTASADFAPGRGFFVEEEVGPGDQRRPKGNFYNAIETESVYRPQTGFVESRKEPESLPVLQPKELILDEVMLNYVAEQMELLRKHLQGRGVNLEAEFSKYEKGGYIDFAVFCDVLKVHEVDLHNQDVMDAFYSYLKEDQEGKVSAKRVYDVLIDGKHLMQYKSKKTSRHGTVAAGIQMKKLADYMEENKISVSVFKNYAVGGRVIKKDHLEKCLKEMRYNFTQVELDAIFKTIDIKDNGNGSLPHLMAILNEHSTKRDQQKPQLDPIVQETITMLNKELVEKGISGTQLYYALDRNGDGYVDKAEFISGITRAGFKVTPEKLGLLFTSLDIHQTSMLSINDLLLHITGAKHAVRDRISDLSIDDQIKLEIDKLFERLDKDHNGVLSENELFTAISVSSHNRYTREEVKEIMKTLDTNQNGFLERSEFEAFMMNQIKHDILSAEDEMDDLRTKFKEYDLDGNGWLTPEEICTLLRQKYPTIQTEDLEAVFEEIDANKDGKIDIDEFIGFMHSSSQALQMDKDSKKYKAVLSLKHQRRFSPNDFMNYFEKISVSTLYVPSFMSGLHSVGKNLPSESFKLKKDVTGLGYADMKSVIGPDKKPTKVLKEIVPTIAGYIVLQSATGIPIPDPMILKRENIVARAVKIAFYDNTATKFVHGSAIITAGWDGASEDVWSFNTVGEVGTNPVVFKWCDSATIKQIDVIFEFIASVRYNILRLTLITIGKGPRYQKCLMDGLKSPQKSLPKLPASHSKFVLAPHFVLL